MYDLQYARVPYGISVIAEGKSIPVNAEQKAKVCVPKEDKLEGNATSGKLEHILNASLPIRVIPSGITTSARLVS